MMKVLILTKDKSVFSPESAAREDLVKCSERVDALHVIVITSKKDAYVFSKVSDKLFLYPTNSAYSWLFLRDVHAIVRTYIFQETAMIADLICARDSVGAALAGYLLSWKYEKNYIIDLLDGNFLFQASGNLILSNLRAKLLDYVFARASAVRVVSQIQGEILYARNPKLEKRIYILPVPSARRNAVETEIKTAHFGNIHDKFKQFNIILLAASRFMSAQDLNTATSVMNELRNRYPRIGLVIISKTYDPGGHQLFARSLPDSIVVEKESPESASYYEKANAFIDIGSDGYGSEELIYAMHAGCPIIASNTPANANIVQDGENGFICDTQDPKLFARKVMEILEKRGLREMMAMYKYNITDLYGTDPEDYYKRLIDIWETYSSIVREQTEKSDLYPAFTLDTVNKAFRKAKEIEQKNRPAYRIMDESEIFDTDSVKIGIEKALAEIEQDEDFEIKEDETTEVDT